MKLRQQGMLLIEALLGILIFSIGVLALIAMQASAISAQTDAQVRVEASNLVDKLVNKMWVNVDRTSLATLQTSLTGTGGFVYQPTETSWCNFSGANSPSLNAIVADWVNDVTTGTGTRLPGVGANMVSVAINTAANSYNSVTVSICWKAPNDAVARKHSIVTYIN